MKRYLNNIKILNTFWPWLMIILVNVKMFWLSSFQTVIYWISNILTSLINRYSALWNQVQTRPLIFKQIDSKTIRSSQVPTFWQACCVCLRRHCGLLVWRPGQSVWEPGSKEKRSVPLTWPWIFPNVQLYQRSPFPLSGFDKLLP